MSRFHSLKISDVHRETEDAVSLTFDVERHLKRTFSFKPGQYLTLRAKINGREVRRCYSICSGVDDGDLRVAVKRVDNGCFSTFALDNLKAGQWIEVMPPQGRFCLPIDPTATRRYVLCATGSGITPMLSIIKSVLSREPGSKILLFYGNKTRADTLFGPDLSVLEAAHPGRLCTYRFFSREPAAGDEYFGRIDARVIDLASRALGGLDQVDACFLCGVPEMTRELGDAFLGAGLPEKRLFIELFDVPPGDKATPPGVVPDAVATLRIGGESFTVKLASRTILDAALEEGIELPYSCRTGSCSTCLARIVEGSAHMLVNNAIGQPEVDRGFILSCQTMSKTPHITLDFDVTDADLNN